MDDDYGQEIAAPKGKRQVLNKLAVFKGVTEGIISILDQFIHKAQLSNAKYFKKTLNNLLDKLFQLEDEDDEIHEENKDKKTGLLYTMKK